MLRVVFRNGVGFRSAVEVLGLPAAAGGQHCSSFPWLHEQKRYKKKNLRKRLRERRIKYEGRMTVTDAIAQLRKDTRRNFVESLELAINLYLDPRKPDQNIRTTCVIPHGTGQEVKIAVFADGEKAEEAKRSGADIVGLDEIVEQVTEGKIDFDRCFATPHAMKYAGKVARILGPKNLMPSVKLGTVTNDIENAVSNAKKGEVILKTQRLNGVVQCTIGKLSLTNEQLEENATAIVNKLVAEKPAGARKSRYWRSAYMKSTMGGAVRLFIGQPPFLVRRSKEKTLAAQRDVVVKRCSSEILQTADNDLGNDNSMGESEQKLGAM